MNANPPPTDFGFPPVDTGFPPALIPRQVEPNRIPPMLQIPPQVAIPPPQAPPPQAPPPQGPSPPAQSEPDVKSPSFQPPSHASPSASSSRGGKPEISFAIDEAAQSAPAVFKQEPQPGQLPIFFGTPPPQPWFSGTPQPWFNGNAQGGVGWPSFQNRQQQLPQGFQPIPAPVPIPPPPPAAFQSRPPAFRPPSPPAASRPFFPPNFSVPQRPSNGNKLVPLCPNGLRALTFQDGGVIRCLPGQQQCPQDASCNFNGLDFYCCPFISETGAGVRTSRPPDDAANGQTEGQN